MSHKFIGFDVESGGITHDTSLLTAYFGIYNEKFELIDDLYLHVKPKDGVYKVTAEALNVNGIDLKAHDKISATHEAAAEALYNFIKGHSEGGKNKLQPIGHNITFDIEFVCAHLISKKTWNQFVSYRILDLGVLVSALKLAGKLPLGISGSLSSICKHFNIKLDNAHEAKSDTLATVEGIKRCVELMK